MPPERPVLLLASASPRRKALLELCGFEIIVSPADVPEERLPQESATDMAQRLAQAKARAVYESAPPDLSRAVLLLAADTVVHLPTDSGELIFGKPEDESQANFMLRSLSGRWHRVTTGYCLWSQRGWRVGSVCTEVRFRTLETREILAYVQTGEPMDKAGAYGIQGLGAFLVAETRGSYTNVIGLPIEEILDPGTGWVR